jgi:NADH:ubiquinone oxidoreductase subunit 2 (subunit N)
MNLKTLTIILGAAGVVVSAISLYYQVKYYNYLFGDSEKANE